MTGEDRPTRRQLLACLGAGATGGLAGCSYLPWPGNRERDAEQVALTIKTVPADDDELAATIISQLRENYTAAGIDTTHEPVAVTELYRDVLVDREYDVFVTRASALTEPDTLRRLLHSRFRGEEGWQNPFNFTNVTIDNLLEKQHATDGEEREAHLVELLELLGETSPFTIVAFPGHRNGRRIALPDTERSSPNRAIGYLELLTREPVDGPWNGPLRVGLSGDGFTEGFNPIGAAAGRVNPIVELLYDPLVRCVEDEYVPWLAESVSWEDESASWAGTDGLDATVELRDGLSWHDGEPITAGDVTFTVEFLEDTSLGEIEGGVPAPRFRGRQTTIASASRIDSRTVALEFDTPSREIAAYALTIPLLPEHVWEPRAEPAGDHETEARVTDNVEPIGSGLLAFDERSVGEYVSYELFDEHVLLDPDTRNRPEVLEEDLAYTGVEFHVAPVQGALTEMLLDGEVDVTGTPLSSAVAERIREESGVALDHGPVDTMYLIGYNLHHPQLGDPRFRTALSRLIDREYVVEEFFDGYGFAPETYGELVGIRSELVRTPENSTLTNFPGSDGEVDADRVRRLFESKGYRYVDGQLLT